MKDLLWAEAVLGRDAQDFLAGEIGQYVLGRCELEISEAQDELARVSVWRKNRIRHLQNQIWRAQSMRLWLAELVQNGARAETILDNETD